MRQEEGLCSIQYEPCNDQSFRIGPMIGSGGPGAGGVPGSGGVPGVGGVPGAGVPGGKYFL